MITTTNDLAEEIQFPLNGIGTCAIALRLLACPARDKNTADSNADNEQNATAVFRVGCV